MRQQPLLFSKLGDKIVYVSYGITVPLINRLGRITYKTFILSAYFSLGM